MQQLTHYWQSIRTPGTRMPDRRAVRPTREIAAFMPYLILLEHTGDDLVFRLIGSGHRERMSLDVTGHRYGEFISPRRIARGAARTRAMFDAACAARILVRECYQGERFEDVVMTCFPLVDGETGRPFFLVHAGATLAMNEMLEVEKPFLIQPFIGFEFLDLGNGLPPEEMRAKYEVAFPSHMAG